MFCKNCGKEQIGGKKFCTNCGLAIYGPILNTESSKDQVKSRSISNIWQKINTSKIVIILVILGFIGYGVYSNRDQGAIDTNNTAINSFDSGNNTQAIAQFQDASSNATSSDTKIQTLKNLAYVYSSDLQYDKAVSTFQEALKLTTSGSFDYYLISGEISALQNKPSLAYVSYTKAYQIKPDDYQINNALALFDMDLEGQHPEFEDYKNALTYAQKAYNESNLEAAKQNLGMAYYFNEKYDQAISTFVSISLDKDTLTAYWLGLSYARNNDVSNAKLYLQKAINNGVKVPQEVYDYLNSH